MDIQYSLNHPNILKLYDHFEDELNLYLVLEYCERGELASLIKKKKTLSQEEAVNVMK